MKRFLLVSFLFPYKTLFFVVMFMRPGSGMSLPGGYAVEPVLKVVVGHLDRAMTARAEYLSTGSPADFASLQWAVRELKADADALRIVRGWSQEARCLGQVREAINRSLSRMDATMACRRKTVETA